MNQFFPKKIYYVECPEDSTVRVAMDVQIKNQAITWFDTVKDRNMQIAKIIDSDPDHFVFLRAGQTSDLRYTFIPLTLDLYQDKIKPYLIDGKDFSTIEDLEAALEATKNYA